MMNSFDQLLELAASLPGYALAAILLIALILAFLLFAPTVRKLWARFRQARAAHAIQKDLSLWGNLSKLAKGEDAADELKAAHHNRSDAVKQDFRRGFALLRQNRYVAAKLPWFLMLGEPSAGKTKLLAESGLELTPSADFADKASPALCFWLGGRAVVLDFDGRLFFDRWLGGSSAEMRTLETLIAETHRRLPLSGIILAVPADALIADDRQLARRKAMLIAAELESLTARLGMIVPVHLVVTKLDRAAGFADFMSELDEHMRQQCFGWQADPARSPAEGFDEAAFERFWHETLKRLRAGVPRLMLSKSVLGRGGEGMSRLDKTAGIYLFPESFDELREPLGIYLRTIFGGDDFTGVRSAPLAGVWFTSAEQTGGALSRALAAMTGSPVDDAVIPPSSASTSSKPFFIREMLGQAVFTMTPAARFTRAESLRRRAPQYAATLICLTLAGWWSWAALFESDRFQAELAPMQTYYGALCDAFRDGRIAHSPLLGIDGRGEPRTLFDAPMAGMPTMTRQEFFQTGWQRAQAPMHAPWGFKTASLAVFGLSRDLERDTRRFLFDQVQSQMSYLPALTLLEHDFVASPERPFTKAKRDALFALLEISRYRSVVGWKDRSGNPLYSKGTLEAFLGHLYPAMPENAVAMLSSFEPKYDKLADRLNATIVLSRDYEAACRAGVESMLRSFEAGNAYPASAYQKMRRAAAAGEELSRAYQDAVALAEPGKVHDAASLDAWQKAARIAAQASGEFEADIRQAIRSERRTPTAAQKLFSKALQKDEAQESASAAALVNDRIAEAYKAYQAALSGDVGALRDLTGGEASSSGASLHRLFSAEAIDLAASHMKRRLADDHAALTAQIERIRGDELFSPAPAKAEDPALAPFSFELFATLMKLSALPESSASQLPEAGVLAPAAFLEKWRALEKELDDQSRQLEAFLQDHGDAKVIKPLAAAAPQFLALDADRARIRLAEALLKHYPASGSTASTASALSFSIGESASKRAADSPETERFSLDAARRVLGFVPSGPEYDPYAAEVELSAVAKLAEAAAASSAAKESKAEEKPSAAPRLFVSALGKNPRWQRLKAAASDYARDYVRWWGAVGDRAAPRASGWSGFRRLAAQSEAYRVNAQLLALYDTASDALDRLPASLLDRAGAKEADAAREKIDARRKELTTDFTAACSSMLSAWRMLPEGADDANRFVVGLSSEARAQLALADAAGIPWWKRFSEAGVRLMKTSAAASWQSRFSSKHLSVMRFPLVADAPSGEKALTSVEMAEISDALLDFGIRGAAANASDPLAEAIAALAQSNQKEEPAAKPLDLSACASAKACGERLQQAAMLLLEREKPLEWTLVLPDAKHHEALVKRLGEGLPSALGRYRYCSAAAGATSEAPLQRRATSSAKPLDLTVARIGAGTLTVQLLEFSDDEAAEAHIEIAGGWAGMRLWLDPKGFYDKAAGIVWTPHVVADRMGAKSVLVLGVRMSQSIAAPADWPRTSNCSLACRP